MSVERTGRQQTSVERTTLACQRHSNNARRYMGRGAVYIMMTKLADLEADVCFTIEGRADDELPEVVLGAATFTGLQLSKAFKNLSPAATA